MPEAVLKRIGTLLLALIASAHSLQADFFVAPNGADANPGTKAHPFASLERARDALREQKEHGSSPPGEVSIWLRAGDYFRTNALDLTQADAGSPDQPVIWRAYPGERVRLIGGRVLRGFQPVSDPAVLNRLEARARGHVLGLDLRRAGITEFGAMRSRGFGRPSTPAHCELFYGGQPMTLARWPNVGAFEKIAGFPETEGKGDDHGGKIGDLPGGFYYDGERPRRWRDVKDVWVHGYWAWDWANSYERVASLDPDRHWVKTAAPYGLYGFRKGQRFYFLNLLEEIDEPGEWFLDGTTGWLYFWPPDAVASTPGSAALRRTGGGLAREVVLSVLDQPLVRLTGVSHVTIRGLVMEATRGNAVEVREGQSNRIAGCLIRNIGDNGVVISGGHGHGVVDSDILDTGDGGVSVSGGDRQTLAPGGHLVENCHFQRQGRWSKCYVPAVLLSGVGHRVAHNLIHDHPHCAILFSGNEHRIEFNEIHHVALETGDVGAIYTGRDYTFRGNQIRHNFIHHTGGVGMGSMGVYMDDCVSGTEIFGNIFYKVQRAVFLGGGRDHRVENNIFVECNPSIQLDGRGLAPQPVWHDMIYQYMRRQLAAVPQELYRRRYPEIAELDSYYRSTNGIPPEHNLAAHNISVRGPWLEIHWHAKPEWLDLRHNLVDADPQFVDADKMDFRLRPDSPAWKSGFESIPVGAIGLQTTAERQALEKLSHSLQP